MPPINLSQQFSQHSPFTPPTAPPGAVAPPAPPASPAPGQPSVPPDPTMVAWRRQSGWRQLGEQHHSPAMAAANGVGNAMATQGLPGSASPLSPLMDAIRGNGTPGVQMGQNNPLLDALRPQQRPVPQVNL